MCGEDAETISHMFLRCPEVKRVWYFSPLRLNVEERVGIPFGEWCGKLQQIHKEKEWWEIFWNVLWSIWNRRNKWVFEGKKIEVLEVIQHSVGRAGEYVKANDHEQMLVAAQKYDNLWKAPPAGCIKVNSDAAIFKDNSIGLGGVARDNEGDVVMATCRKWRGNFDVEVAEAIGMRHALKIAREAGFKVLILETDNFQLYHQLTSRKAPSSSFGNVVNDILVMSRACDSVSFSFVKREGNRVAHNLAKGSENVVEELVWLEDYPPEVGRVVLDDLQFMLS
ncbi:uncharacterized protein LOC125494128 [Beta vulgaris subsp. vulgaris]|uniref:uncharacterized protein LOC125494128 n=1 Tax=Beta vulgaris subsp. vulgaris TaxID=3555 RepID=UPI00203717A9|nr:uncharacterized protein LOC125494128 [Beta vulgaris subsp. vulgaris]